MAFIESGISIDPDEWRRTMRKETYDLSDRIRPLGEQCLVLLDPKAGVTAGGIILESMMQDQPTTGQVVAVGSRCTAVRVGDRVTFGKWNGRPLPDHITRELGFQPEELYVMRPVTGDPKQPVTSDHIFATLE